MPKPITEKKKKPSSETCSKYIYSNIVPLDYTDKTSIVLSGGGSDLSLFHLIVSLLHLISNGIVKMFFKWFILVINEEQKYQLGDIERYR